MPYPWWYERAVSHEEVEREMEVIALQPEPPGPPRLLAYESEDGRNVLYTLAVERVVRRTVSDKLKEWLRGVASWGPEGRKEAIRSGKRMKELGWML
jgi:hypothetical protein